MTAKHPMSIYFRPLSPAIKNKKRTYAKNEINRGSFTKTGLLEVLCVPFSILLDSSNIHILISLAC